VLDKLPIKLLAMRTSREGSVKLTRPHSLGFEFLAAGRVRTIEVQKGRALGFK
jgi:hypothetical protein